MASRRRNDNSKERKKKKNDDSSPGSLHANWKNSTLCNMHVNASCETH